MHGYGRQIPQWCVGFHYKPRRPAASSSRPGSQAASFDSCERGRPHRIDSALNLLNLFLNSGAECAGHGAGRND
eukprot:COSAG01_NODE_285_length_19434_cov_131.491777_16_plen_74_part_00